MRTSMATLGRVPLSSEKSLASLLAERDLFNKLPTWPWSVATLRGVASAILLPVLIFVLTRVIDRLI